MKHLGKIQPGPWRATTVGPKRLPVIADKFGYIVAHLGDDETGGMLESLEGSSPLQRAKLIEAAPDLLEAAQEALFALECCHMQADARHSVDAARMAEFVARYLPALRAAIAKATGTDDETD